MLIYLINASIIWLCSLVFFEFVLKKETFHQANRIFLMISFLLGWLLPLIQIEPERFDNELIIAAQYGSENFKQAIVKNTVATSASDFNWENMLRWIYGTGVVVSFLLLMKEIFFLIHFYKKGVKTKFSSYTLIETRQNHSPFSWGKYIFMTSADSYSKKELDMIICHELAHYHAGHLIDKCCFSVFKIFCWFHPLVYVYYNRLMLVHEYEADASQKSNQNQYGRFLIEQALLQSHSVITHSFNYSPIKNRIAMLTKNASPKIKMTKFAIMLPLLLVFLICATQQIQSQVKNDERKIVNNKMMFKGNEIEFTEELVDSTTIVDPMTGENLVLVTRLAPEPIKINGQKIYLDDVVDAKPILKNSNQKTATYIFNKIKDKAAALQDGEYNSLINVVLDKKGHIVYYDKISTHKKGGKIADDEQPAIHELNNAIEQIVNELELTPAMLNGNPAIARFSYFFNFEVEDNTATLL